MLSDETLTHIQYHTWKPQFKLCSPETWKAEALINMAYRSAHNTALLRSQHNGHGPGETCPHSRSSDVSKLIQLFHLNPIFDMDTLMQAPGRSNSVSVLFVQFKLVSQYNI